MFKKAYLYLLPAVLLFIFTDCASSPKEKPQSPADSVEAAESTKLFIKLAPDVSEKMLKSDFWLEKCREPDKVIMNTAQIALWNSVMSDTVALDNPDFYLVNDLRTADPVMKAEDIRRHIIYYNPSFPWYKKIQTKSGYKIHTLNEKDFKVFWNEMNMESLASWKEYINQKWIKMKPNPKEFKIKKGICIRRSNLKLIPEDNFYSDDKEYWYDDISQNSGILMNEPVLVLWYSRDGKWLYVQTSYCFGWIHREDIAFCTDEEFDRHFDYTLKGETFVTVTAERCTLGNEYLLTNLGPEPKMPKLFMGTYIELASIDESEFELIQKQSGRTPYGSYIVKIPFKKADESLGYNYAVIPESVCVRGLLPYTQRNELKLAFSSLGQRYGWGGMAESRDCSEYTKDIFRCFGFTFARNSRSQMAMPGVSVDFEKLSDSEKTARLDKIPAGTLMGVLGHVFLYLGKEDDKYYAISALGSYYPDGKDFTRKVDANSVNVNTMDVRRKTGKTWTEALMQAKLLVDDGNFEERKITLDKKWEFASFSKINSGAAGINRAKKNIKKFVVAVNAGHGTKGGSAVKTYCHPDKSPKVTGGTTAKGETQSYAVSDGMYFYDKTSEAYVNLQVALLLKDKLLNEGFDVLMLRSTDDVQLDNIARTVIANNNAHIHVAIHFDGDSQKKDKGCFYCGIPEELKKFKNVRAHYENSEKLGNFLTNSLKNCGLQLYNEGRYEVDLTQTSFSTIPTVDIELGNSHTRHDLVSLEKRAQAICDGIKKYYEAIK